jgi:hypothetical protein
MVSMARLGISFNDGSTVLAMLDLVMVGIHTMGKKKGGG